MRKSIIASLVFFALAYFSPEANCDPTTKNTASQLETLTVTAQKREEQQQAVPISMDTFSDIRIEDAQIENTFDLSRFSPNAHMKYNYYENLIVIRGISTFRASLYSPTGFYVDDVCYPLQFMQKMDLFDTERVEILKGPQSTLYGRNAEAGVINVTTRQPGNQIQSKVFAECGSYNTVRSGASISGPVVTDRFYIGSSFQYKSSDGFMENESTGNDTDADLKHINGRATLRWTPAERWDISVITGMMNADDHCGGHRFVSGANATIPFHFKSDSDEYYREDGNNQILRVKYAGEAFDVFMVSGVLYDKLKKLNDTDMGDDPANQKIHTTQFEDRQYSQELRIFSSRKGTFEWLAGLYGFIDETKIDYRYDLVSAGKIYMNPISDIDAGGYAAFGQTTYTLFDKLHLTTGLRLDHQNLDGHVEDAVNKKGCRENLSYDELLPKLSAAYDLTRDVMFYASAAKGYSAGGYNYSMIPEAETFTYQPEYTWNYELGIKAVWMNNKLMANLAMFYIDIEDKQVMEYDWDTLAKTITNAATAHSQGFELQLEARPVQGLNLFAGWGYNEAEFDAFTSTEWNADNTTLIEKDYEGNDLPYAPEYTYNIGAQYRSADGFYARVDLLGSGRFYGDAANTSKQDAYETINLRLGYEGEHFDLYLWADNVFNEQYLTFVYPYRDNVVGLDGPPGTVGMTVVWRY